MFKEASTFIKRVTPRDLVYLVAVLLLFFVSGACGLVYQVVWTRKLVLLFGSTSYAVSTVLSIFFIGLGAGSFFGGRLADGASARGGARRLLFLYGAFEAVIGLWALAIILLIDAGEAFLINALQAWAATRAGAIGLRALLSLFFLIVPVFLMGATLPLLSKAVTARGERWSGRIGLLYSVNTFGAVAGCALSGFLLLPELGYFRSTLIGVAANIVIGAMAITLALRQARIAGEGIQAVPAADASRPLLFRLLAFCFALSGFCALALEVIWTRLLATVFLGTTYAFTTMLTALLCGIAAGSACASVFIDKRRRPVFLFGVVEFAIGVSCVLMLPLFAGLPARLQAMQLAAGYDWQGIIQAKFVLSFTVLFAPTFLFGMTFPLVVRAAATLTPARDGCAPAALGRHIGALYSANTFGGVFGAAAGGFLLIPLLGTQHGIIALAAALAVSGAAITICSELKAKWKTLALAAGAVVFAGACMAAPADVSRALTTGFVPTDHKVIHYREGVEGTVAVSEPKDNAGGSDRVLWINAVQATASIEKGVKMNRFEGILPLLLDRDPRRVLFMCFGSGVTVGTLGLYDYERIDAVEISADVLAAAPLFQRDNFDVRNNPRVRFHVDDGRNFLLTSNDRYDVITFEPMPLALAGVSTFYTREYYRLCMDHLTPGGLVSQWVPLHSLDPMVVRDLTATFISVFPEYCAWYINADMFLVGSNQPIHIDYARAAQRLALPEINAAARAVGLADPAEIINCFLMDKAAVGQYARGGSIMTDDRPWAEFVAPKLMYLRTVDKTLAELVPLMSAPQTIMKLPATGAEEPLRRVSVRHEARVKDFQGVIEYYGGSFGSKPEVCFEEALGIDPEDATAKYYLNEIMDARVKLFARWREPEKAVAALQEAIKAAPGERQLHLFLGDAYFDQGQKALAAESYRAYMRLGGAESRAAERGKI